MLLNFVKLNQSWSDFFIVALKSHLLVHNKRMQKYLLFLSLIGINSWTIAQSHDDSLMKTQDLLRDPTQRNAAIKGDSKAMDADQKVKALAGDQQTTEAIYGLSSDVLQAIHKSAGGDAQKMQKIIEDIARDPEKMKIYLRPELRTKLENAAKAVETNQKKLP